jgi:hypothetical protein
VKVLVYVEGRSDVDGLRVLFRDLLTRKEQDGVAISFHEARKGDRKDWLLTAGVVNAVNILRGDPDTRVVIVPDLYPTSDRPFPHRTSDELISGIRRAFEHQVRRRGADERIIARFAAFCFKYEFEVLLLAAEKALCAHLKCGKLRLDWKRPPEDQDDGDPQKRVIRHLFHAHGAFYDSVLTPAEVLRNASCRDLREACPQCFAPFVDFLESA